MSPSRRWRKKKNKKVEEKVSLKKVTTFSEALVAEMKSRLILKRKKPQ